MNRLLAGVVLGLVGLIGGAVLTRDRYFDSQGVPAASAQRKVVYLPGIVEACLRDLKGSLETDPDTARALLGQLIGQIRLRREGRRLWWSSSETCLAC